MKRVLFFSLLFFIFTKGFAQQPPVRQVFFLTSLLPDSVQLHDAKSLSVDLSGDVYIADTGNNRILKISPSGEVLDAIGGFGWEAEQFYTPLDIGAESGLDVFVADYNNHRIQRYDKDLNYISSLVSDENWAEEFQFAYPKSVAISRHGDLFLIDGENIRILKFDSFGEPEISFGDYAEGKGQLLEPVQLAISADDLIYVSDRQAKKVFVFDYFGNYVGEIGARILAGPRGIFFSNGKLFVADADKREIFIFKPDGELIFHWSKINNARGDFRQPEDVTAFQNKIFVLDGDEILVFEIK